MKVSTPTNTKPTKEHHFVIPFEAPERREDDERAISFTCRHDPEKGKDSTSYTLTAHVFNDGTPEELLLLIKKISDISKGQALTTNEKKVKLFEQLFEGTALTAFQGELPDGSSDAITDNMLRKGIAAIKAVVFPEPAKAARAQKKAMKALKKPLGMKFRDFANRMRELNGYLAHFPALANGRAPSSMSQEEFLEMLHDALPRAGYIDVMQQHDFDAGASDFKTLVWWVETRCEPFDKKGGNKASPLEQPIPRKNKRKNRGSGGKRDQSDRPAKRATKYCVHHGNGDHDTDGCNYIKNLLKKANNKPKSNWKDKKQDSHAQEVAQAICQSEDFHAMMQKITTQTCNKLFKAFKRDRDHDSDLEDNHMVDIDLEQLNLTLDQEEE